MSAAEKMERAETGHARFGDLKACGLGAARLFFVLTPPAKGRKDAAPITPYAAKLSLACKIAGCPICVKNIFVGIE